ncbi:MAG TPA: hypothetical protein VKP68_05790 [Ramlibacter sp.]|nr:hypothetical protein [Ramlibacter sp.]
MHTIHLDEIHVPKSHGLFYTAIGALACFAFALLTFLVAWFGGGREVANQLGGQVTLGVLLIGVAASAGFAVLTNPKDWKPD